MAAKNKENLQKLLEFLDKSILHEPENKWFLENLRDKLIPASDERINRIYEFCIEDIIKKQAEEFYKDFILTDLKDVLIKDFIRMEHWRRRNNLDEFGMAVFQQIECIINKLGSDTIISNVYTNTKNALCYVDYSDPKVSNRYPKSKYSIGQFVFFDPDKYKDLIHKTLPVLPVYYKFKVINYYICHKASLQMSEYNQFSDEMKIFSEIYALRNKNHRGNNQTNEEIDKLKNFEDNPSRAFLTITAFLSWFINSVNQGYPLSKELLDFAKQEFSEPKPLTPSLRFTGEKIPLEQLERGRRRR